MIRILVSGPKPSLVNFNTDRYVSRMMQATRELSRHAGNTPSNAVLLEPGQKPKNVHTTINTKATIFDDDDIFCMRT
jgi:hypothetical protein